MNYSDQWWVSLYISTLVVVIFGSLDTETGDQQSLDSKPVPSWSARYGYCNPIIGYSWSEVLKPYNSGDPRAGK